jgi:hypothetical protein
MKTIVMFLLFFLGMGLLAHKITSRMHLLLIVVIVGTVLYISLK